MNNKPKPPVKQPMRVWKWNLMTVLANTKSEARAKFKELQNPLPKGIQIKEIK